MAGVDFWSEVGPHSEQVDLMVEPSQVSKVNPYVITSLTFWHYITGIFTFIVHPFYIVAHNLWHKEAQY